MISVCGYPQTQKVKRARVADSSNTRLDARIEAAAKAIFDEVTGYEDFWDRNKFKETWLTCAEYALAAADSVERPDVERLVAALRFYADPESWRRHNYVPDPAGASYDEAEIKDDRGKRARAALAEFGQQPTGDEQ